MKTIKNWDNDIKAMFNDKVSKIIKNDENSLFIEVISDLMQARRFYKIFIFEVKQLKNKWIDISCKYKEILSFDWHDDLVYDVWVAKYVSIKKSPQVVVQNKSQDKSTATKELDFFDKGV